MGKSALDMLREGTTLEGHGQVAEIKTNQIHVKKSTTLPAQWPVRD